MDRTPFVIASSLMSSNENFTRISDFPYTMTKFHQSQMSNSITVDEIDAGVEKVWKYAEYCTFPELNVTAAGFTEMDETGLLKTTPAMLLALPSPPGVPSVLMKGSRQHKRRNGNDKKKIRTNNHHLIPLSGTRSQEYQYEGVLFFS